MLRLVYPPKEFPKSKCLITHACLPLLLSGALYSDIRTLRGLPASLEGRAWASSCRREPRAMAERWQPGRGRLLGTRKPRLPGPDPPAGNSDQDGPTVLGSCRFSLADTCQENPKFQAPLVFPSSLSISQTDSACFSLFYLSILEILKNVSHPTPPTKLPGWLWKLSRGHFLQLQGPALC